jgi:phenylpyruvate tautomerase PptA (4-oxalocrotonate tautomerase family)
MPLVRIALRRGKSPAYLAALRNGIYQAMRDTFDVPENYRFILLSQHDADEFDCDATYLDIARSDDLVIVQIACNDSRTLAKKQALYRRVAEILAADPGLRPEDVFINLLETGKENWSFGHGVAQYAPDVAATGSG